MDCSSRYRYADGADDQEDYIVPKPRPVMGLAGMEQFSVKEDYEWYIRAGKSLKSAGILHIYPTTNLEDVIIYEEEIDVPKSMTRIAKCDRDVLIEMCKTIAPEISSINPSGINPSDDWSSYYPVRTILSGYGWLSNSRLCISLKRVDYNWRRRDWRSKISLSGNYVNRAYQQLFKLYACSFVCDICSDDKRITELHLNGDRRFAIALPEAIGGLHRLQRLSLNSVRSLPYQALSTLPSLKHLKITFADHIFCRNMSTKDYENFLKDLSRTKLSHLMSFSIDFYSTCHYPNPSSAFSPRSSLRQWAKKSLPSLEDLYISHLDYRSIPIDKSMTFCKSLKRITFRECNMDESHLEILLFGVLPFSPTVIELDLSRNSIKSFQSIKRRLINLVDKEFLSQSNLRVFQYDRNPIRWKGCKDDEVDALCRILRAFPTIEESGLEEHPLVRCELLFNRARRKLAEASTSPPPALWPLILGRLNDLLDCEHGDESDCTRLNDIAVATGMFHVLRNFPALFESIDTTTMNTAVVERKQSPSDYFPDFADERFYYILLVLLLLPWEGLIEKN